MAPCEVKETTSPSTVFPTGKAATKCDESQWLVHRRRRGRRCFFLVARPPCSRPPSILGPAGPGPCRRLACFVGAGRPSWRWRSSPVPPTSWRPRCFLAAAPSRLLGLARRMQGLLHRLVDGAREAGSSLASPAGGGRRRDRPGVSTGAAAGGLPGLGRPLGRLLGRPGQLRPPWPGPDSGSFFGAGLRRGGPALGSPDGRRGVKIQPTPGTGFPPMSRPSSKSHGCSPWNSWNESLESTMAPVRSAMRKTKASPRPMAPAGGETISPLSIASRSVSRSDSSTRCSNGRVDDDDDAAPGSSSA